MIYNIDWNILNAVQVFRCNFLDFVLSKITILGESGAFWIVVCILMMFFRQTRKCGFSIAVCLILCLILGNGILKPLIARPRPYMLNPDIIISGIPLSDNFSFPSGHTYSSVGSAVIIWYYLKYKWGIAAMILAILIAFSRVYFQMHFVTDILGGVILGIVAAAAGIILINAIYRKYE